ncbi:MBL fold metallo-hydrolase [Glycomyces fuscus]|nr:MBL fold metallo-hydrolase [Glycomyces fuscus]
MRLTKKAHAGIRLEKDGRVLVIDPGAFTEADATDGADAVLITHEHPDHFAEDRVRAALEARPGAEVWTERAVAERLSAAFPGRVHAVGAGDAFTAAGFDVRVYGEHHSVIHPDIPRIGNVGFLVEGAVFHPGDAFTVPDQPVRTLMVPVHAPWSKAAEVVDYIREVRPDRAVDIHDALLTDLARPIYDRLVGGLGGAEHLRLASGDTLEV